MFIKTAAKPASQDESFLYLHVGEALCMIQLLEGALSTSITLKKDVQHPHRLSRVEADNLLKEYRSYTLGRAIKLAKQHNIYSDTVYNDLKVILEERNWLVHKFLHHHLDDMHVDVARKNLFHRIKNISNHAKMLQETIESDLIIYSESVGLDMSRVRAYIKQYSNCI